MNAEQRRNIISKLTEVINDDRAALLKEVLEKRTHYLTVILDDIYLPQNASAIIRTSECLGVQNIHSIQERNTHKINRNVVNGASKWINVERYDGSTGRKCCVKTLKHQGYKIVAMTLKADAVPLEELPIDTKLALSFGCEETGLSKDIEDNADYKVQIPITGFTQSYNVSVSAGISLYYLLNKIKSSSLSWQLNQEEKDRLFIDWLSKSTPAGEALLGRYTEETNA